LTSSSFYFT